MPQWGFDDSWTRYPLTPALGAIKDALTFGFAGESAIGYLKTRGIPCAVVNAGDPWPGAPDYALVMWYRKGDGANGNFQWVDKTPDGPYLHGWDVRWDPNSWVDGPVPNGFPVGADGKHPTRWQIKPNAEPVATPAPVPTPAPTPAPVAGPPDWFLAAMVDVHKLLDELVDLNTNVQALSAKLDGLAKSGVRVHF